MLDAVQNARPPTVSLRASQPGDLGWVVHRHGALYWQEQGWDERFEAIVANVAAAFLKQHDPEREACWIAEVDGQRAGCVLVVQGSDEVAKLRLLLVEPHARGLGIGRILVQRCIDFARTHGYRTLSLWTNSNLLAARAIYQKAGFRCTHSEPHTLFGHDLTGEVWELALSTGL